MSRKIGIIGMGHVGSTVAHGLIAQGAFDDYVLIDTNEKKVMADAVDFQDAAANINHHANIEINHYPALSDADVIVIALGNIALQDIQMQIGLQNCHLQQPRFPMWRSKSSSLVFLV